MVVVPLKPQEGNVSHVSVEQSSLDLTILMPCLNEAETIEVCVRKATTWLASSGLSGEVLVADNGSRDGSQGMAEALGARVVEEVQDFYAPGDTRLWSAITKDDLERVRARYTRLKLVS